MSNVVLPSSPADRQKIKDAMQEISNSMTRIEGERGYIVDTVKEICKTYQLPNRAFRKLVTVYHKQNFNEECASHEEFEALYGTLVK